jgi:hypothetical protein
MRIYHKRRLPTGRQKLWMHCTRFIGARILIRHIRYGVAGIPHRNAFRDHIVAFTWFWQARTGRSCHKNLVGARCI